MRILHVFDHSIPLQSGYSFRSRSILLEQRRRGWETVHITGGKQGAVDAAFQEVGELGFYRTPPLTAFKQRLPILNQLAISLDLERRIREVVTQTAPDIIHAHSPALNGLAALRVGRDLGIPVVYEIRAFWEDAAVDHGTSKEDDFRYRATRWLETYVARRVDAIATICEGLRNDLSARAIDSTRISVIPNAVDVERFEYQQPRDSSLEERFELKDRPVIGFIGSFYGYEGVTDLVGALPSIIAQLPELKVLLVGGGPRYDEVVTMVSDLGLEKHVICAGRVPHTEVSQYYTLIDVLCYPRQRMRLTDLVTPLKPLEAMAQGKIVVASDVGGHRELIKHGENGILYPAGNSASLAQAIVGTIGERSHWPKLQQQGRNFVETERSWKSSVARYEDVYHTATERFEVRQGV